MREIYHTFEKDNRCIWYNIKCYYSSGIKIISQKICDNGSVDVVVKAKSKKQWDLLLKNGNR